MSYTVRVKREGKIEVVRVSFSQLCEMLQDSRPAPEFWRGEKSHTREDLNIKILMQ